MFAELMDVRLKNYTYDYVNSGSEEDILKTFKEELRRILNILENLINGDFKNMSDTEFYSLIFEVYSITFHNKDYLNIISKLKNKKDNKI